MKMTHVGEQTGPVATVVIQSYFYLPSLDVFREFQSGRSLYANDDLPVILNFSVAPSDLKTLLSEATKVAEEMRGGKPASLSLVALADTPEGLQGGEFLFPLESGAVLHQRLAKSLDAEYQIGQTVLAIQRSAAYSMLDSA